MYGNSRSHGMNIAIDTTGKSNNMNESGDQQRDRNGPDGSRQSAGQKRPPPGNSDLSRNVIDLPQRTRTDHNQNDDGANFQYDNLGRNPEIRYQHNLHHHAFPPSANQMRPDHNLAAAMAAAVATPSHISPLSDSERLLKALIANRTAPDASRYGTATAVDGMTAGTLHMAARNDVASAWGPSSRLGLGMGLAQPANYRGLSAPAGVTANTTGYPFQTTAAAAAAALSPPVAGLLSSYPHDNSTARMAYEVSTIRHLRQEEAFRQSLAAASMLESIEDPRNPHGGGGPSPLTRMGHNSYSESTSMRNPMLGWGESGMFSGDTERERPGVFQDPQTFQRYQQQQQSTPEFLTPNSNFLSALPGNSVLQPPSDAQLFAGDNSSVSMFRGPASLPFSARSNSQLSRQHHHNLSQLSPPTVYQPGSHEVPGRRSVLLNALAQPASAPSSQERLLFDNSRIQPDLGFASLLRRSEAMLPQESSMAPFPTNAASTTGMTGTPRHEGLLRTLAHPDDKLILSSHQVLLRHQIQVFEATAADTVTHTKGRNKPIRVGQVGIRCKHCANIDPSRRQKGSMYFPATTMGLYQASQNMSSTHLQCGLCSEMPDSLKDHFAALIPSKATGSLAGRPYWAKSAQEMGLIDTDDGIRYRPN